MSTTAVTGHLILDNFVFIVGSDTVTGNTHSSGLPFQILCSVYGACVAVTWWHLLPLLPVTECHLLLPFHFGWEIGETLAHPWALLGALKFPGNLKRWGRKTLVNFFFLLSFLNNLTKTLSVYCIDWVEIENHSQCFFKVGFFFHMLSSLSSFCGSVCLLLTRLLDSG